jgi:hypothetical protein
LKDFNFLAYVTSIEKMMTAWHDYSQVVLQNSTNLGGAREHFIKEILSTFLPKGVVVGSGEITDGERRSGQQDVIIYRSDFPVLTGFGGVNTFLIEGVIATIEVKSDLSTGSPIGIISANKNVASVLSLTNTALKIKGTAEEFANLMRVHTVKTYIVGYKGWSSKQKFIQNYQLAANQTGGIVADIVFQPKGCIIKNSEIANIYTDLGVIPSSIVPAVYCSSHPFAIFFQHLLRAILTRMGGLKISSPGIEAEMLYDLNKYFSLPSIPCVNIYRKD